MVKEFKTFEIVHVTRKKIVCVIMLGKLASTKKSGLNRTMIHKIFHTLNTKFVEVVMIKNDESWMTHIIKYLTKKCLLAEEKPQKIIVMSQQCCPSMLNNSKD